MNKFPNLRWHFSVSGRFKFIVLLMSFIVLNQQTLFHLVTFFPYDSLDMNFVCHHQNEEPKQ